MNYKKFLYKAERKLYRRWQHPLFFIKDNLAIAFSMAKMQTLLIASQMYHEKDVKCWSRNENTNEWEEGIIKANKESKEDFEAQKNLDIAQVWCNYAIAIVDIYLMAFTGKKSDIKFDFKEEYIKIFIKQLKDLKENKE
jgi:hypothetical protein